MINKETSVIPFNMPSIADGAAEYIDVLLKDPALFHQRYFSKECAKWFKGIYPNGKFLITNSCTQSLELAAILLDLKPGDEVIMPSFTYVSTANAFVLRGATPVFVDIRPDTMNIDERKIEAAITNKTKAIVPVHYAGVACAMDAIVNIAKKHQLKIIEDNAHGILAKYNGQDLGSFSDISCISFDYLKNITCGEGGGIIVNDPSLVERLEMVYENGTNRIQFLKGQADKYVWKDVGSNFYPSDLNAAFLISQLKQAESITNHRLELWNQYRHKLEDLRKNGLLELPEMPVSTEHNGHIFYVKCKNINERQRLMDHLKEKGIYSSFHYIPLHSTAFGKKSGRFNGEDEFTTKESERLLRLPIYYSLTAADVDYITSSVIDFYRS